MEYLESQLRQKLASVVWTHKIQEKQADYYKRLYSIMDYVKVITAIISIGTVFISTYFKLKDLKGLHQNIKKQLYNYWI